MNSQLLEVPHSTFHKPPLDYSLTYLDMVDYNVLHSPSHPVFRYLQSDGSTRIINWKEAGAAFYNAARIIQAKCNASHVTKDSPNPVVVGILANIDSLTYVAIVIGIMLAGFVPFPISNRNSSAAVAHLLREGDCKAIITTQDHVTQSKVDKAFQIFNENEPNVEPVLSISAPPYEDLFENAEIGKGYPPLRKFRDVTHDSLCIIMHSSGSVSFPKAIKYSYRMMVQRALVMSMGEVDVCGEIFGGHGIPIYHALGICVLVTCCVALGMSLSLLSPKETSVPSPDLALTNAVQTNCAFVACVPSFIESWAQDQRKVALLKGFKAILYGGGPLSTTIGNMLVKEGINIVPLYGATEVGGLSLAIPRKPPSEGWEWLRTSPGADLVFVPTDMADKKIYRLVVKAGRFKTLAVSNTMIDNIPAYDTNDLVIRHPTNPMLWKIFGREDDQIIHSTGVKTNPTPIEGQLLKDPRISAAVMFGHSKFQPGVLVQPSPSYAFDPNDEVKLEEYRNLIWETVELANKDAPQQSRIFKEFILIANPSKPFEFTAKGTPKRHAVLKAYSPEIENIYQASEQYTLTKVPAPVNWKLDEVRQFLRAVIVSVLGLDITDSESIFLAGADSLAAISIRNSIMHALRQSNPISSSHIRSLPSDAVYMFPSVDALSAYIYGFLTFAFETQPQSTKYTASVKEDVNEVKIRAHKEPTVVKLQGGNPGETPLIIFHGAGGTIASLRPMSEKYHSALWAIQHTEEAPLTSIEALAEFYYGKIKEEQPTGPYRLAAYSGSSLLLVQLVQLIESKGDIVSQFDFLDHFPTIFLERIDVSNLGSLVARKAMINDASRRGAEDISRAVMETSTGADKGLRKKLGEDMLSALDGKSSNELACLLVNTSRSMIQISLEFLLGGRFFSTDDRHNRHWSKEMILNWMRKVKKTPTVYVAKDGLRARFEIDDLGAGLVYEDAKVVGIEGNHFSFLLNPELLRRLEDY
ncbi:hypothetical protein BDQ17DRAFT_1288470, partial [Cyathus striatus]